MHKAVVELYGAENGTRFVELWERDVCSVSMNVDHQERHLEGEMHADVLARNLDAGGGGPGGGRGGRRGRRVDPYNGLTLSEEEAIMERLKWLGRGRIPGGGGCSSGDDFPGDYDSEPP
ncbi:hypothetical protein PM082_006421 [Marasmius tenuissimus]|nr:hypothetical protein PM082_006421 [Marasmius tenuissimus]